VDVVNARHPIMETIDWAVAFEPAPGQQICGDGYIVAPFGVGILLGVADGLGHGPQAAAASREAIATLEHTVARTLEDAMAACHERLRHSRGVALSLAVIEPARDNLTWAGVGNVEAMLYRTPSAKRPARQTIIPRGGVVGRSLPSLRPASMQITPGAVLILATDGVSAQFSEYVPGSDSPQQIANEIVCTYRRPEDDVLALVVRYLGRRHEQEEHIS
jgi:phosphoserine phosphatase RsbX